MKNSKTSCHRSYKLDKLLGIYVTVLFTDGDIVCGKLMYEEERGTYRLDCPWSDSDVVFHKTLVRKVVV